jgi:putative tricarboxylic transport membrane protein
MRSPRVRSDLVAAGSLLVLGLLYGALAVGEGLGSVGDTGAGFFPFVVALVLVAASGTVLVRSRRGAVPAAEEEDDGDVRWWRVAGVLGAALLVPAVGETVGMVVTLSVALVLIARVMGVSRWWRAVVLGVAFGAATWLVFVYWLYVPLPAGTLGLV